MLIGGKRMQIFFWVILEVYLFGMGVLNCAAIMQSGMLIFMVTVLGACFANVIIVVSIGNLCRYGYCRLHKINPFPLVIYPFVVIKKDDRRYEIKVSLRLEFLFRMILPMQVIDEVLKEEENTEEKQDGTAVFIRSLTVQYIGRLIAIILITVLEAVLLHSVLICVYGTGLIIAQSCLSGEFSHSYMGERGLKSQIINRENQVISYAVSQLPLYSEIDCELYLNYEKHLEETDAILLCEWTLEALSQMYILDYSGKIILEEKFKIYIRQNISELKDVQGATILWYFLTLHMNWALAKKSKEDVFQFLSMVQKMKREYEDLLTWLAKWRKSNFFVWYINVAQNQRMELNWRKKARFQMLKRDYMCAVSQEYREYYTHLSRDIWNLCEKYQNTRH